MEPGFQTLKGPHIHPSEVKHASRDADRACMHEAYCRRVFEVTAPKVEKHFCILGYYVCSYQLVIQS